jgi:hypothetical protein
VYRCLVANSVGTIVSRDVTVRAGKLSSWFVQKDNRYYGVR